MAYFKIVEPNKDPKYIKEIDRANTKLKFSKNRKGCFQQDSGFFADSEAMYLKFHFKEEYPELEYMKIVDEWEEREAEQRATHGRDVARNEVEGLNAMPAMPDVVNEPVLIRR